MRTVSSIAQAGSVVAAITTRGSSALSYGGGIISTQSLRRVARHIRWIRHSMMAPVAIVVAILAGVTHTVISDVVVTIGRLFPSMYGTGLPESRCHGWGIHGCGFSRPFLRMRGVTSRK